MFHFFSSWYLFFFSFNVVLYMFGREWERVRERPLNAERKMWKDGYGWWWCVCKCIKRGKTRLKQNTRMPWKSKCEDPAIFTHPQSYPFTDKTSLSSHCCCCFWWIFCENAVSLLIHFEGLHIHFFSGFCDYRPLCRNVYALIMNCFSARIPTELKLFNFPYFLLSSLLLPPPRLLLLPPFSF